MLALDVEVDPVVFQIEASVLVLDAIVVGVAELEVVVDAVVEAPEEVIDDVDTKEDVPPLAMLLDEVIVVET